jgi:quercetin dioxygenase-like cupin family protein
VRKFLLIGVLATTLALLTATATLAALVTGSLPTTAFTYTAVTDNEVNMAGPGIHLKTEDSANVKTTYSLVAPSAGFSSGWHYHHGPAIITVTVGTLTLFNKTCGARDVTAGHTYIESTGQVLDALVLPAKNAGITTVEWFTTRLYPRGAVDPVPVAAPCTP